MAVAYRFVCDRCSHALVAWEDGNPYYLDDDGAKRYAYHPQHELLDRCIGNDEPHLCVACGDESRVDSRAPIDRCPACRAATLVPSTRVDGCRCPWCGRGRLRVAPGIHAIS